MERIAIESVKESVKESVGVRSWKASCGSCGRWPNAIINRAILMLCLGLAMACSVITDFDDSRVKLNLEKELYSEDIDIRTRIHGDATGELGRILFHFKDMFESRDGAALVELFSNQMKLEIAEAAPNAVGVRINVRAVKDTPVNPGEFQVAVGNEGALLVVTFFNGTGDDAIVTAGDDVKLILALDENPLLKNDILSYVVPVD
ncbi:MAG: hypothetical protein JXR76_11760 [Deltaproteobacteria bacterium]|nr:hypothetical protein [Deltaproteobacteria bacterium]